MQLARILGRHDAENQKDDIAARGLAVLAEQWLKTGDARFECEG
jgi:hypothetical protein